MELKNVLIVDDDIELLDLLESILESNYKIFKASSAIKALEIIENNNFQLIVTDVKMPHKDGIYLLDKLQKMFYNIPVIIMTGGVDIQVAVAALKKGAFDIIAKPFDQDMLFITIQRALKYYEAIEINEMLFQEYKDLSNTVKKLAIKYHDHLIEAESMSFKRMDFESSQKELANRIEKIRERSKIEKMKFEIETKIKDLEKKYMKSQLSFAVNETDEDKK